MGKVISVSYGRLQVLSTLVSFTVTVLKQLLTYFISQDMENFNIFSHGHHLIGKIGEAEVSRINQTNFILLRRPHTLEEKQITELRKLLNSGTFYFLLSSNSEPADITLCTQKVKHNPSTDSHFFWNRYYSQSKMLETN